MRRIDRLVFTALVSLAATTPGALSSASSAADTVQVVLTEYRFAPDHLTFERGHRYRLVLEDRGKEAHEFTAPDFFRAIALENPTVLTDGEVVLQPGERKTLRFAAEQPGRFKLFCSDHDWTGMIGEIEIR
jgi:uncharacterized cupredoxin-like copper-binding protein